MLSAGTYDVKLFGSSMGSDVDQNSTGFGYLSTYSESDTLSFSIASVNAVPETSSWAMMIIGIGAIGGLLRRVYRKSGKTYTRKVRHSRLPDPFR